MQREDGRDVFDDALIHHYFPSTPAFLRRLEDELDGAAYAVPHPRKRVGRSDEHAGVPVVATGMHPAFYLRSERQARLLLYGEGVHVCPQGHGSSVAFTLESGDDTVLGDARLYVEGQTVERREHFFGGPLRTEAQFGLAVDIPAEGDDLLTEVLFDLCLQTFELLRYIHKVSSLGGFWKGRPFQKPRWSASQHFSQSAFCLLKADTALGLQGKGTIECGSDCGLWRPEGRLARQSFRSEACDKIVG